MESKKTLAITALALILGVFLISFASAEFWVCFGEGEVRDYCDNQFGVPYKPSKTCSTELCLFCASVYNPVENCYIHGVWNTCLNSPPDCSETAQNVTYDGTPPEFNLSSPSEGELFTDRNVLVEFFLSEESHVYYTILNDEPVRETRICYECGPSYGKFPAFSDERIFDDGLKEVMFRATDLVGNDAYRNVSFFVDSKNPVIKDISPDNGKYSSGEFMVWFNEQNPVELKLFVNYAGGVDEYLVNLGTECAPDRYDTLCTTDINMNKYNGQDIAYHFEIEDIVGNRDISGEEIVKVDSTIPVIRSIREVRDRRYIYFELNYTEENLENIEYVDLLDSRARPKDLCRYPENGVCYGKVTLRNGPHDIQFTVMDEAGNVASEVRSVFLDTVAPRIYKTYPKRRAFADGTFEVQFKELNPARLTLHYGSDSVDLNLINDCYMERGKTYCETDVSLNTYDGMEIEYYFELEDVVGNIGVSRAYEVKVDTTSPVVNNPNDFYEVVGRYVYFSLDITEENLDEVFYVDYRGYDKMICSRLYDGLCEKKISFREGNYSFTVQVTDEAGNSIGIPTGNFEINY